MFKPLPGEEVEGLPEQPWLAVDVGGGTQDVLIYRPRQPMENCTQLVLPSQTVVVAGRIARATREGRPLLLNGSLMGGGASVAAVQAHLKAGLPVYATPRAARTIFDDLERVQALGVTLVEEGGAPPEALAVRMGDLDLAALGRALEPFGLELPERCAVAAQDHGESIGQSNRLFRFQHWRGFVEGGGDIRRLIYREPPAYLTRLKAIQEEAPGTLVADTGASAIWGALCDRQVEARRDEGIVIVNAGNQHTVVSLVQGHRLWGLFEHHTALMAPAKLHDYLRRLLEGSLTQEEVFEDGGHGCYRHPDFRPGDGFRFIAVTGPRRALAGGRYHEAAPFGNMMLAGSYGLLKAIAAIDWT